MKTHLIQGPDGKVHEFEAEDNVTPDQVMAYASSVFAKGRRPAEKMADPTEGMGEVEKAIVGFGKAFVDTGRAAGQHARNLLPSSVADTLGLPTAADIEESRRLDAPLMQHGAAKVGNAVGVGAQAAPLAFLPGANTYAGAAATGALMGALQPYTSGDEFVQNVGLGGAGGAGGLAAGRGLAAGYQVANNTVQPFFQSGQRAIVRDTLRGYATDPARAAAQLRATPSSTIPGAQQTVAEAARDRGLAQLERTLLNHPEFSRNLAEVRNASHVARINALEDIAGDEGKMAFYQTMRRDLASEMYEPFLQQGVNKANVTPWVRGEITKLNKNPVFLEAVDKAKKWVQTEGRNLNEASGLRGLHYAKQAIDDMIEVARPQEGMRLKMVKERLVTLIDKLTDGNYSAVSEQYAQLSRPINQMKIGQALLNRAQPNKYMRGTEVGIRPDAFSRAMSNPDSTARAATGYGKASMSRTMDPEQMATLNEIGRQFAGRGFAEGAGRAAGSNTAQNLVSQNFLRQVLGPLGLPHGWGEAAARSTLGQTLMRPGQWVAQLGESRVMPMLADVMADPALAARLLTESERRTLSRLLAAGIDPLLPAAGAAYALPANR